MDDKLKQIYLTMIALAQVAIESHSGCSQATQNLEHQMFILDEIMRDCNE